MGPWFQNSVCAQSISSIVKELDGARSTCLKFLKDLLHLLNLPSGVNKSWVQYYCMPNAELLLCTTPVRECELVIPLHWLTECNGNTVWIASPSLYCLISLSHCCIYHKINFLYWYAIFSSLRNIVTAISFLMFHCYWSVFHNFNSYFSIIISMYAKSWIRDKFIWENSYAQI